MTDVVDQPTIKFHAVKFEGFRFWQHRGIEGFAIPFDAQVIVRNVPGKRGKMFAQQCPADGNMD